MSLHVWHKTENKTPPEGEEVVVLNGDHAEQYLYYELGMWWTDDTKTSYTYWIPEMWRYNT